MYTIFIDSGFIYSGMNLIVFIHRFPLHRRINGDNSQIYAYANDPFVRTMAVNETHCTGNAVGRTEDKKNECRTTTTTNTKITVHEQLHTL